MIPFHLFPDVSTEVTTVAPEGTSFDGDTDYLSRSSDFVGNTDSKTFTFSCLVYRGQDGIISFPIRSNGGAFRVDVRDTTINIEAYNSSLSLILSLTIDASIRDTWSEVLVSGDMNSQSTIKAYLSDVSNFTINTYVNDTIDFTRSDWYIGSGNGASNFVKGRLSNLYLDYTYRDLSIEANRRLFITADGKPADWATLVALNPILALQMKDASTAHINDGTGGNMTQNGTLATADRGANQDNCVASEFDGSDDSLSNADIGASDGKEFIVSFNFTVGTYNKICEIGTSGGLHSITTDTDGSIVFTFIGPLASSGTIFADTIFTGRAIGTQLSVQVSVDLTDSNNYKVFVEGVNIAVSATTYTNETIVFDSQKITLLANYSGGTFYAGTIGELYFDTTYIDIETSNPFWDTDTSKPIPVRTAMANLGSNPLICMPIDASKPIANYGSGGSFTLNGGGLLGARGASEEISRGAVVDGTDYLTGSIYCESLVKWKSTDGGATWTPTYANATTVTNIGNGTDNGVVAFYMGFSDNINWATESNKNLITNQMGFPRTMATVISESGWTPVLGLDFKDTANFGANLYGADYTETGTITAGADIVA